MRLLKFQELTNTTLLLMLVLSSSLACRSREKSDLQSATTKKAVLPIVIGLSQGFYSCTYAMQDLPASFRRLVEDEAKKNDIDIRLTVVEACFTGGILQNGGREAIKYQVHRSNTDVSPILSIKPDGFTAVLRGAAEQLGAPHDQTHIYMAGHSHGAWLMMQSAENWHGSVNLRSLYTIDPISYSRCTQAYLIGQAIIAGNYPSAAQALNAECTRAPRDLSSSKIKGQLKHAWVNFYQNQFLPLHSGPITEAENIKRSYPNRGIGGMQHQDILTDTEVWDRIRQDIRSDIAQLALSARASAN